VKILVIGDSHGNVANLKHVMGFAKKIGITQVIHTGDWNNIKSVNAVVESDVESLAAVVGNADIDEDMQKLKKDFLKAFKDSMELYLDGRRIYITHRFKKDDNNHIGKDIVFTGHYHSQKVWEQDGVKIVRPGALEKDINFVIYDTKTNDVELINL